MHPGLEGDPRGPHLKQIEARLQRTAIFVKVHGGVAPLIERRINRHRPRTHPLKHHFVPYARIPEVVPQVLIGLRVDAVQTKVEPLDVKMTDQDLSGLAGMIGANDAGHIKLHSRVQPRGAIVDGQRLPRCVAVDIADVRPNLHLVVGARLGAKLDPKNVVVGAEVGEHLCRGNRRRHLQIGHHRGRIDGGVEQYLEGTMGVGTLITILRRGSHNPG